MFCARLVSDLSGRLRSAALGRALLFTASLAVFVPCVGARAEPVLAAEAKDRVISSVQQYWDLTPEQKSRPLPFELKCYVTFFDPQWKMLFIQDLHGSGAYVPYGDNPYVFK